MKKAILSVVIVLVLLLIPSYSGNQTFGERNIKGFLRELYQVDNTDDYQELIEKYSYYLQEISKAQPMEKGVHTIDPADAAEMSRTYIEKYQKYCSENALQELFRTGYITRFDQLAWEEECQFFVRELQVMQDHGPQYSYIVEVERRAKDGSFQTKKSKGKVLLNEEGYVERFRITSWAEF